MSERVGLGNITFAAHWLDQQLRDRLGRPYQALLSVGLIISISGTVQSLTKAFSAANLLVAAGAVVFQAALLINQLAQLYEYRQDRIARREARKAAAAPRDRAAS